MFCLISSSKLSSKNLNFHWRWRWWDWIQAIFLNLFYFNEDGAKEGTKAGTEEGTEEGTEDGTEDGTDGEYDEYKENDYEGEGYDYSLDHLPQDDFQVESERATQEKFAKSSSKVPSR